MLLHSACVRALLERHRIVPETFRSRLKATSVDGERHGIDRGRSQARGASSSLTAHRGVRHGGDGHARARATRGVGRRRRNELRPAPGLETRHCRRMCARSCRTARRRMTSRGESQGVRRNRFRKRRETPCPNSASVRIRRWTPRSRARTGTNRRRGRSLRPCGETASSARRIDGRSFSNIVGRGFASGGPSLNFNSTESFGPALGTSPPTTASSHRPRRPPRRSRRRRIVFVRREYKGEEGQARAV